MRRELNWIQPRPDEEKQTKNVQITVQCTVQTVKRTLCTFCTAYSVVWLLRLSTVCGGRRVWGGRSPDTRACMPVK